MDTHGFAVGDKVFTAFVSPTGAERGIYHNHVMAGTIVALVDGVDGGRDEVVLRRSYGVSTAPASDLHRTEADALRWVANRLRHYAAVVVSEAERTEKLAAKDDASVGTDDVALVGEDEK